jgi:hypothetical protein
MALGLKQKGCHGQLLPFYENKRRFGFRLRKVFKVAVKMFGFKFMHNKLFLD